ncbi:MAG: gamma carbonic anhydrase family protein [Methanobacteriota archaeon]|nr:MAG: gamma carbonic anhydrase family protein [Euryarchaeota archaeon]
MIYVAETAAITGDVAIGRDSSVWHGAVLRGDLDAIVVGKYVSVQDNAVVHVDLGNPVVIGDRVTVGHGAVVHGCEIGEECIIGMGAIVGSRAKVGRGSILGAGAVVPEGMEVQRDSLALGVPAKVLRRTEDFHRLRIEASWRVYAELARKTLPARPERAADPSTRVRIEGVAGLDKLF